MSTRIHKGQRQIRRSAHVKKAHIRKAHTRKAFKRSNGVLVKATKVKASRVKKTRVPATWVKDMGALGKTPVRKKFLKKPLKKGSMMGYSTKLDATARRNKLKNLVKKTSYKTVVLELNARRNLMKKSVPQVSKKMSNDLKWMKSRQNALKKFKVLKGIELKN